MAGGAGFLLLPVAEAFTSPFVGRVDPLFTVGDALFDDLVTVPPTLDVAGSCII